MWRLQSKQALETECGFYTFLEEYLNVAIGHASAAGDLPKRLLSITDDVMKRGHLQDNAEAMDSVAFGRGVFYMRGFTGYNGTVFDTVLRQTVNCTLKTFEGDDMFNISSLDVAQYHQPHNNDSFTCLAPWPNGTQQFQTNGTHVKCMPKNSEFFEFDFFAFVLTKVLAW